MANLTRKQKRRLELTGNLVRMYIAVITFVFAFLAVLRADHKYDMMERADMVPDIPRAATYGTIAGIYMPLFAAVAAYIWATRAVPNRQEAPHGFGMALFRDLFTILVVSVLLFLPVGLYGARTPIRDVNTLLVWYQTIIAAGVGGAFAYYFRATLYPGVANERKRTARRPRAQPAARAAAPAAGEDAATE